MSVTYRYLGHHLNVIRQVDVSREWLLGRGDHGSDSIQPKVAVILPQVAPSAYSPLAAPERQIEGMNGSFCVLLTLVVVMDVQGLCFSYGEPYCVPMRCILLAVKKDGRLHVFKVQVIQIFLRSRLNFVKQCLGG